MKKANKQKGEAIQKAIREIKGCIQLVESAGDTGGTIASAREAVVSIIEMVSFKFETIDIKNGLEDDGQVEELEDLCVLIEAQEWSLQQAHDSLVDIRNV